ncbi:hypothetical protein CKO31_05595 [Thiohalocapsa halophila]|uniref:Endonuclease GajA/Old nuclease/RecF-like AAA domain-containing protein n=1 Tax=Thiohalocapsa halophila TaxID=69359 RepID=A0ABS1CE90_9GAMM|nr:hypothetical protein [Thiohalocapsa halophila]
MILKALTLENFKGIREPVRIEFAPLTLLFGPNNAGKSTIVQALMYAREVLERDNCDVGRTELGGDVVDLGGFKNLVHDQDYRNRAIRMRFQLDLSQIGLPDFRRPRRCTRANWWPVASAMPGCGGAGGWCWPTARRRAGTTPRRAKLSIRSRRANARAWASRSCAWWYYCVWPAARCSTWPRGPARAKAATSRRYCAGRRVDKRSAVHQVTGGRSAWNQFFMSPDTWVAAAHRRAAGWPQTGANRAPSAQAPPKSFPLLTKPRAEAREEVLLNGHPKKQR